MPIDTQSMLLKLNPLSAIDPGGNIAQMGAERQRLAFEREKWEAAKRAAEEKARYEREAANAKITREALAAKATADEKAAAAQAVVDAKALESRQAAALKFAEASAKDPESAEALVPLMRDLGMGVDITRNPTGLPSFRVHENAAEDAALEQAELDQNWETAERPIYEDAYGEAPEQPGVPQIAPATPTGNLIDLQAMQDQRAARLGPAMEKLNAAYPTAELRGSAALTSEGILASGLQGEKMIEEYRQQRTAPDAAYRSLLEADTKEGNREGLSRMERERLASNGERMGGKLAATYAVKDIVERRRTLATARDVLLDDNKINDHLVGATISRMMGERGSTTEQDVQRALGTAAMSFLEQIKSGFHKAAFGGLSSTQKNALIAVLDSSEKADISRAHDFLSAVDEMADDPTMDPEVARGLRLQRSVIPRDIRNMYDEKRGKKAGDAPTGATTQAGGDDDKAAVVDEVMIQAADAGLDSEAILSMFGGESGGGDRSAANPNSSAKGILQFTNETARGMGFKDAAEYAALPAAEQVAATIKYFQSKGLDENSPPEDYAIATAAPGFLGESGDTVVYREGSEEHTINKPWWPKGGGDITVDSIIAYYRSKGLGKAPKAEAAPAAPAPESLGVQKVGAVPAAKNAKDKAALDWLETL